MISVIIPTYNRKKYVQEAIDSVVLQSFTDHEIIVVDDGSTDGTGNVLQTRYGDRITYCYQENRGESSARNRGIAMASGQYIAFLDSDDIWFPTKLEEQVRFLERRKDIGLVFSQAEQIDWRGEVNPGRIYGAGTRTEDLTLGNLSVENLIAAGGSTVMVRSSVLRKTGGFDPALRFGEDWDMWLRLRRKTKFAIIRKRLAQIRYHSSSQSYVPSRDEIDRRLHDHLKIMNHASNFSETGENNIARNRSMARRYAEAAFASFVWQNWEQGRKYLECAASLYPQYWLGLDNLLHYARSYGMALINAHDTITSEMLLSYTRGVEASLPHGLNLSVLQRRKLCSAIAADISFYFYLENDQGAALSWGLTAIAANPFLVRNFGLVRRLATCL